MPNAKLRSPLLKGAAQLRMAEIEFANRQNEKAGASTEPEKADNPQGDPPPLLLSIHSLCTGRLSLGNARLLTPSQSGVAPISKFSRRLQLLRVRKSRHRPISRLMSRTILGIRRVRAKRHSKFMKSQLHQQKTPLRKRKTVRKGSRTQGFRRP